VVVKPAVIVKLREYLLVWENALVAREHGMVEDEHALGGHAWNVMPFTTGLGASNRTTEPGCEPLSSASGVP
jgi:hypothetical protein